MPDLPLHTDCGWLASLGARYLHVVSDAGVCTVWWSSVDTYDDALWTLLDPPEVSRIARLLRPADRVRSTIGAGLLRLAVSARFGVPATDVVVDRACMHCDRPHGKPTLPGTGLHASISHSGQWVAVALTEAGPVGVDVEAVVNVDIASLAETVLSREEARTANTPADFFAYWTRKESVIKATGDGLAVDVANVLVTPPESPPAVRAYPGRPELCARMYDLAAPSGYLAAVTVLTENQITVVEDDAATLRDAALRTAPSKGGPSS